MNESGFSFDNVELLLVPCSVLDPVWDDVSLTLPLPLRWNLKDKIWIIRRKPHAFVSLFVLFVHDTDDVSFDSCPCSSKWGTSSDDGRETFGSSTVITAVLVLSRFKLGDRPNKPMVDTFDCDIPGSKIFIGWHGKYDYSTTASKHLYLEVAYTTSFRNCAVVDSCCFYPSKYRQIPYTARQLREYVCWIIRSWWTILYFSFVQSHFDFVSRNRSHIYDSMDGTQYFHWVGSLKKYYYVGSSCWGQV